jgi:hypothetical protein
MIGRFAIWWFAMGILKVRTGMQLEIELVDQAGSTEPQVFAIVPDRYADYARGLLGEGTPLAQVLMGKRVGEEVPYRLDDIVSVRILSAHPVDLNTASKLGQREAEFRKALADLNRRNAAAFAASFSGKRGDYDPDGVEEWDKDQKPEE